MKYIIIQYILLATSFVRRVVHGSLKPNALEIGKHSQKILVVQMAKLGDMVCTTPVFAALKKQFPAAHVTVMGNTINAEVLSGNTDIDEYIKFDGIVNVFRRLKSEQFQTALIVGPDMISAALAYLAGIPCIVVPKIEGGYSPLESWSYRTLRRTAGFAVVTHTMGHYAPKEYLSVLQPLGIHADDTSKKIFFNTESGSAVNTFFVEQGIVSTDLVIGISPSAGNKIKNWGGEKWAAVVQKLWEKYQVKIIIIGGSRDVKEVEAVHVHLKDVPVVNASGRWSVDELKALISKLDLFVAVDTGPIYIAEALGIPTVDIVGPMDEREQPPVGPLHALVVPPPPRVPQLHIMDAHPKDAREALRQVESITVDMVVEACVGVISQLEKIRRP